MSESKHTTKWRAVVGKDESLCNRGRRRYFPHVVTNEEAYRHSGGRIGAIPVSEGPIGEPIPEDPANFGADERVDWLAQLTPYDRTARLIAAAPQMLEALRRARPVVADRVGKRDPHGLLAAIDAAIAAATGGE